MIAVLVDRADLRGEVIPRGVPVVRKQSVAVYALTAFFGLQVGFASSSVLLNLPFLAYQPPYWRTLLIYGCGAAYVACLCWRQSPRARFAAYIFLSVDVMRAMRGNHWWTVLIDLAVIIAMQTPTFRAVYPPIRPGGRHSHDPSGAGLGSSRARAEIPPTGCAAPRAGVRRWISRA
jgi:hypothetical protein